jgi:hypothetical protein
VGKSHLSSLGHTERGVSYGQDERRDEIREMFISTFEIKFNKIRFSKYFGDVRFLLKVLSRRKPTRHVKIASRVCPRYRIRVFGW